MAAITLKLTRRILAYVWLLGVTSTRSLEIALNVMRKISLITSSFFDELAGELLNGISNDDSLIDDPRWPGISKNVLSKLLNDGYGGLTSTPPINRSSMVPKGFWSAFPICLNFQPARLFGRPWPKGGAGFLQY